jgi:hypothetical protein
MRLKHEGDRLFIDQRFLQAMVANEKIAAFDYQNEEGRNLVAMALLNSGVCAFELNKNS